MYKSHVQYQGTSLWLKPKPPHPAEPPMLHISARRANTQICATPTTSSSYLSSSSPLAVCTGKLTSSSRRSCPSCPTTLWYTSLSCRPTGKVACRCVCRVRSHKPSSQELNTSTAGDAIRTTMTLVWASSRRSRRWAKHKDKGIILKIE